MYLAILKHEDRGEDVQSSLCCCKVIVIVVVVAVVVIAGLVLHNSGLHHDLSNLGRRREKIVHTRIEVRCLLLCAVC